MIEKEDNQDKGYNFEGLPVDLLEIYHRIALEKLKVFFPNAEWPTFFGCTGLLHNEFNEAIQKIKLYINKCQSHGLFHIVADFKKIDLYETIVDMLFLTIKWKKYLYTIETLEIDYQLSKDIFYPAMKFTYDIVWGKLEENIAALDKKIEEEDKEIKNKPRRRIVYGESYGRVTSKESWDE
jgi:hypothetical protein